MTDMIAIFSESGYEELPTPSTYKVVDQEINSMAERNLDYILQKERGAIKKQISLSWNNIEPPDFQRICALTGSNTFDVSFYDPQVGSVLNGTFYRDNTFDYTVNGVWDDGPEYITVTRLVLTEV